MPHDRELIDYRIQRAEQSLKEATWAIEKKTLSLAENRIYYAIFYIVSALALKYEFSTSKHSTLRWWFNQLFLKTKKIDIEFGKTYTIAFEKRQKADYDDFIVFSLQEVLSDLGNAELFVEKIKKILQEDCRL